MRRAVVYRVIKRNCFGVKIDHLPGVSEVHCTTVDLQDRLAFDRKCRTLEPMRFTKTSSSPPAPILHKTTGGKGDEPNCVIEVSVALGPYCMKSKAFVNCQLQYPPAPHLENVSFDEEGAQEYGASDPVNAAEDNVEKEGGETNQLRSEKRCTPDYPMQDNGAGGDSSPEATVSPAKVQKTGE